MAWEEFTSKGMSGVCGDKPVDEFAMAMKRIVEAYQVSFSRKPTMLEVLHALETVIGAEPAAFVSDPQGIEYADFVVHRSP